MIREIAFDNSYARLPPRFFARQDPVPVAAPRLLVLNRALALGLGLDPDWLSGPEGSAMLAGNRMPPGAEPLAQAYAGHQFGNWVPQLGDGRAVLLGELIDSAGQRRDLQLKGAGRTPFSRGGDGRAWLGPVIREYLVSEAMHALGLPTTRALAIVATGEEVQRELPRPGAILTRIAASHIRIGTFQYFAARNDVEALEALTAHATARHHPEAVDAMGLLRAVTAAQARLIAGWMAVGFIHGVMNTDNMSISGETIDYGPCAFMDGFHPARVFSSIDRFGRYSWQNQPQVAVWNLSRLASALLPVMGGEAAIPEATEVIEGFADLYQQAWTERFCAKLALDPAEPGNAGLVHRLLEDMAAVEADFTITFRGLAEGRETPLDLSPGHEVWLKDWQARRDGSAEARRAMLGASPAVIPRNHRIEAVITAALAGDLGPFHALNAVLADPCGPAPEEWRRPPLPAERVERTFCGT